MSNDQSKWLVLWSRLSAGDQVDEIEIEELRAAINSDSKLRKAIFVDRNADLLLGAHFQINSIESSEDEFVNDTLKQWNNLSAVENEPENHAVITESETAQPLAPPPLKDSPKRKTRLPQSASDVPFQINLAKPAKRQGRRRVRNGAYRIVGIACASLTFLAMASFAVFSWMNQHSNNIADRDKPATKPGNSIKSNPLPKNAIAKLIETENAVWQRNRKRGDLIGQEELRLLKGDAQLEFTDGAIVKLSAPSVVKLNAGDDILLSHGQIAATVPAKAIGFKVQTPTTQIVDLGTEFDVLVDEIGETDVYVRTGKVDVCSNVLDQSDATWSLTAEDINRARFFRRFESPLGPIAANVYGNNGQFQGMISVDGKMMRFDSSQAFDNVRQNVMERFKSSPDDTVRSWSEFVSTSQSASFSSGSVSVNGVQVEFNNLEEAIQLQQKIQDKLRQSNSNGGSTTSAETFSATIVINGKVRQFTSRKEYEDAKKEIFGSAADFGAGMLGDK